MGAKKEYVLVTSDTDGCEVCASEGVIVRKIGGGVEKVGLGRRAGSP